VNKRSGECFYGHESPNITKRPKIMSSTACNSELLVLGMFHAEPKSDIHVTSCCLVICFNVTVCLTTLAVCSCSVQREND